LKSQAGSVSQPAVSHGAPSGEPLSFVLNICSSARARCLSRPPRVSEEAPIRVFSSTVSRSSAYQRKQPHPTPNGSPLTRAVQAAAGKPWPKGGTHDRVDKR
jgi:hypothetical protein